MLPAESPGLENIGCRNVEIGVKAGVLIWDCANVGLKPGCYGIKPTFLRICTLWLNPRKGPFKQGVGARADPILGKVRLNERSRGGTHK